MSSISGEQSLIDGYNLRNEEFPRGKEFYAQLASAAFNMPYWECTEFRQPIKVEEFLEIVPEAFSVQLEDDSIVSAKDLQLGQSIITDEGILKVTSKEKVDGGYRLNGEIVSRLQKDNTELLW